MICRVCGGEHAVRRCPALSLPSIQGRGRDLILDGRLFDETAERLQELYDGNLDLIAIEVRHRTPMNIPTLSIILPTIGRETLERTLESIYLQIGPADEVLVVSDGDNPSVAALCRVYGDRFKYSVCCDRDSCFGQAQRNFGIERAENDYLAFIGDDDVFNEGALEAIRQASKCHPGRLLIFKVNTWSSGVVWKDGIREIKEGYVDASCAVFPNVKDRLGRFTYRYQGDFDFIYQTVALYPFGSIVWQPEVIITCRPATFEDTP